MKMLIANGITMSRAPLAIATVLLMLYQMWAPSWVCFLTCVATDVIDGPLARRWKVETQVGAMLDFRSDITMFWVLLIGVCMYAFKYYPPTMVQTTDWMLKVSIVFLVVYLALWKWHLAIFQWWKVKGNFWCGVIPDAIIGLWISWHAGPWAVLVTITYGVAAIWYNAEKIKTRFL